jgi:hypothetical protein
MKPIPPAAPGLPPDRAGGSEGAPGSFVVSQGARAKQGKFYVAFAVEAVIVPTRF